MILVEIKNYLADLDRPANLMELAEHFRQEPAIVRHMLSHWLRKGVIQRVANPVNCGTACVRCKPELAETYQFVK